MKIQEIKTSTANNKALYKNGLITARGIENWTTEEFKNIAGFANTTEIVDNLGISSHSNTLIEVNGITYNVKYYSGCFYPIFTRCLFIGKAEGKLKINRFSKKTKSFKLV